MKRTASWALVFALSTALVLSGAVAAKDHPAGGKGGPHTTTSGQAGSKATSLKVKGNASHPGGTFRVLAVLKAAVGDRPPTISAIVHFTSGDVAVTLNRSGNGAAYHGNVPVPANEPAGTVKIDATALVNGATLTATGTGKIVVEGTTETSETASTATTTSAALTSTSTQSATTCTATTTTSTTTTSETTTTTSEATTSETTTSESSDKSESSDATETETADASESSEADESDSCDNETHDLSALTPAPQIIAKLLAFLESVEA